MHCVAGVSRSATVCLGYLMSHEQLRYPEAWRILQRARRDVTCKPRYGCSSPCSPDSASSMMPMRLLAM